MVVWLSVIPRIKIIFDDLDTELEDEELKRKLDRDFTRQDGEYAVYGSSCYVEEEDMYYVGLNPKYGLPRMFFTTIHELLHVWSKHSKNRGLERLVDGVLHYRYFPL